MDLESKVSVAIELAVLGERLGGVAAAHAGGSRRAGLELAVVALQQAAQRAKQNALQT